MTFEHQIRPNIATYRINKLASHVGNIVYHLLRLFKSLKIFKKIQFITQLPFGTLNRVYQIFGTPDSVY